jgi:hypothetical protein
MLSIFENPYIYVKLSYRIVVVLETRTYIYNFDDLRLIDAIETCQNTKGLVALNPDPENAVLATPD